MTDSMRDRLRDELAGWPIGSGYWSTTVSVTDARDMADAVLAVLADPPVKVVERVAEAIEDEEEYPHPRGYRKHALSALAALVGGESDEE